MRLWWLFMPRDRRSPPIGHNDAVLTGQERHDILILLGRIEGKLDRILRKEIKMAGELDNLKAQVAKNTDVIGSAKTLIVGIKAKLDAAIASGDPAQLQALSDQLAADDQGLADAVAANTPAE